nr:RNA-directed DNA polymerase, eukaryota, reverse transcriptase zinc-binding domain protein [Tanacetum cinerariifolium]
WSDIARIGGEIDGVGIEFTSSCVGLFGDGRDIRFWVDRWTLDKNGEFTVKELARLVEEKILHTKSEGHETLWNILVPKKVNIFVWRAIKGRLPVRVELDKRGIDLDSMLCPCCNNSVETCAHCLVTCDLAMSVWDKVFNWWKVGNVNDFSIFELFSSSGGVNVPSFLTRVWQAVIWTSGYFIWKERNARVFGKKVTSTNMIVQDIKLKSFEWIVRRSKKFKEIDWQLWLRDPQTIAISCNPVQHSRTKHIDVRYHFIKEKVEKVHNSVSLVLEVCTFQCAYSSIEEKSSMQGIPLRF